MRFIPPPPNWNPVEQIADLWGSLCSCRLCPACVGVGTVWGCEQWVQIWQKPMHSHPGSQACLSLAVRAWPDSGRVKSSSFIFPVFIDMLPTNCLHIPLPFSRIFPEEENRHTKPPPWLNVGRRLVLFYKTYIKQFSRRPVATGHLILMNYLC